MGLFNFGAPIPDDDTFDGAKEEFKTPVQMQREAGAANEVKEKRRPKWSALSVISLDQKIATTAPL